MNVSVCLFTCMRAFLFVSVSLFVCFISVCAGACVCVCVLACLRLCLVVCAVVCVGVFVCVRA